MANYQLIHEMKRHAVCFAIQAKPTDVENARFVDVTTSFVHNDWKELDDCSGECVAFGDVQKTHTALGEFRENTLHTEVSVN